MTIVEFLRARLDEDEQVAREAIQIRERIYGDRYGSDLTFKAWDDHPAGTVLVGPERVLREVVAKREALEWFAHELTAPMDEGAMRMSEIALRTLAAVYADHPDYRDEWP